MQKEPYNYLEKLIFSLQHIYWVELAGLCASQTNHYKHALLHRKAYVELWDTNLPAPGYRTPSFEWLNAYVNHYKLVESINGSNFEPYSQLVGYSFGVKDFESIQAECTLNGLSSIIILDTNSVAQLGQLYKNLLEQKYDYPNCHLVLNTSENRGRTGGVHKVEMIPYRKLNKEVYRSSYGQIRAWHTFQIWK
jgi:hypothetical protein